MKDRLTDLRNLQNDSPTDYETVIEVEEGPKKTVFLNDFFTQVGEIQQTLAELKEKILETKILHSQILCSPQSDDQVNMAFEQMIQDVQLMMNSVKLKLKKMNKSIKYQESINRGSSAEIRINKCQHVTLSREFVDVISTYDTIQNNYKDSCVKRIKRQLEIVNPNSINFEDSAFEEMIESRNSSIFTQGIITKTQQAKNSLREIEARQNDIIILENSIKELHELFTDVALFVASQGEVVDRIEYNVEQAAEYVQKAVFKTKPAGVYIDKTRRKKIIIIIVCLIFLLILALAIYLSARK